MSPKQFEPPKKRQIIRLSLSLADEVTRNSNNSIQQLGASREASTVLETVDAMPITPSPFTSSKCKESPTKKRDRVNFGNNYAPIARPEIKVTRVLSVRGVQKQLSDHFANTAQPDWKVYSKRVNKCIHTSPRRPKSKPRKRIKVRLGSNSPQQLNAAPKPYKTMQEMYQEIVRFNKDFQGI